MSSEEIIQVVDENTGELLGVALPRHEVLANKYWCRSTNIFVVNIQGDILCHQRSLKKERHPGAWMTHFGGHLAGEETFDENAIKELEEETGITVEPGQILPWRTSKKIIPRLWVRDFITVYDGKLTDLKLQEGEVEQVRWVSPREILEKLDTESVGDEQWLAGTHDFEADYQCIRAVLTAGLALGAFTDQYKHLHRWAPPRHK